MKIKMPHKRWYRVKKELQLTKLPQKINYKGDVKGSYCLQFYDNLAYPRFHFESRFVHRLRTDIDIHIDWTRHKESDSIHDLIKFLIDKIEKIN